MMELPRTETGRHDLDVAVLGWLDVGRDGHSVVPSAAKPRTVLAVLAARTGRTVPVRALLEELWGEEPPGSAVTTLQTYVLQIRGLIAELPGLAGHRGEAKQVLRHEPGGYRLRTGAGLIDVDEFERRAIAGREAAAAHDHATASERFRDALRSWRGTALVDVEQGPLLSAETTRLEALRLEALSSWLEADLRLGRHQQRVADLAGLSAQHPTNERIHALYMLALLDCGRRDRALEVYRRLRRTLKHELGAEPSLACRRVHRLVLAPPLDIGEECALHREALDELAAAPGVAGADHARAP
ncbi:MAG: BTAD domain-containing putative transcriptional regulator [Frankiaceae bacterium]